MQNNQPSFMPRACLRAVSAFLAALKIHFSTLLQVFLNVINVSGKVKPRKPRKV